MRKVGPLTVLFSFLCFALASLGHADELDTLIKQLSDPSAVARAKAAESLGSRKNDVKTSAPALAKCTIDPDPSVRRAAMKALIRLKPSREVMAPLYAKILGDAEPTVALSAVRTMAEEGESVLPRMILAVEDKRTRYWALLVISELGSKSTSTVPTLIKALDDEDRPLVRREILLALGAIGPKASASTEALRKELSNKHGAVQYAALYALGKIGPGAAAAQDEVSKLAESDDATASIIALWARCMIAPSDDKLRHQTIRTLVQRLRDKDNDAREAAARALQNLPKGKGDEKVAVAEFGELCEKCSPEVVADALEAMSSLGPKSVPGLIKALKHKNIRHAIARVLGQIGPEAKDAVPALTAVLAESDNTGRREIVFALGQIGPASAPAVPTLISTLKDADPEVRFSAVFALGQIGVSAAGATDALKNNLADEDPFYRTVSAWALAHVNPQGPEVAKLTVPLLTEALKHDRAFARIEAAKALGQLGAPARSALPALEAASQDENAAVRTAVTAAMAKISGK